MREPTFLHCGTLRRECVIFDEAGAFLFKGNQEFFERFLASLGMTRLEF
jgi:hypothetical protein